MVVLKFPMPSVTAIVPTSKAWSRSNNNTTTESTIRLGDGRPTAQQHNVHEARPACSLRHKSMTSTIDRFALATAAQGEEKGEGNLERERSAGS